MFDVAVTLQHSLHTTSAVTQHRISCSNLSVESSGWFSSTEVLQCKLPQIKRLACLHSVVHSAPSLWNWRVCTATPRMVRLVHWCLRCQLIKVNTRAICCMCWPSTGWQLCNVIHALTSTTVMDVGSECTSTAHCSCLRTQQALKERNITPCTYLQEVQTGSTFCKTSW